MGEDYDKIEAAELALAIRRSLMTNTARFASHIEETQTDGGAAASGPKRRKARRSCLPPATSTEMLDGFIVEATELDGAMRALVDGIAPSAVATLPSEWLFECRPRVLRSQTPQTAHRAPQKSVGTRGRGFTMQRICSYHYTSTAHKP